MKRLWINESYRRLRAWNTHLPNTDALIVWLFHVYPVPVGAYHTHLHTNFPFFSSSADKKDDRSRTGQQ
ncbi:hypothetical protein IAQ61_011311 [Plenodomus lingam]|uniref:uncharacterized protein n=1 Tax=Leptosphaeria maculans TaxID=5022 RepID=UPI00331BCE92|nr:hypothetical protein IAQ61_011311 [Plenodomus lingam]